ncbi:MAG: hypothetical protein HYU36_16040 [Planctomycetes bacterium]|nr:hypothetical protein [Planctomycetota bacterium]
MLQVYDGRQDDLVSNPLRPSSVMKWGFPILLLWPVLLACPARADAPWAQESCPDGPPALFLSSKPEEVPSHWAVTGHLRLADDAFLGRKVYEVPAKASLHLQSLKTLTGAYRVDALVRISDRPGGSGSVRLRCGVVDAARPRAQAFSLALSRYGEKGCMLTPMMGEGTLWTQPHPNALPNDRWKPVQVIERYPGAKISPLWDEDFRIRIENDMARLPHGNDLWRRIRAEVTSRSIRIYHNGLLVVEDENRVRSDGALRLELGGEAWLASLEVFPSRPGVSAYETVPLSDVCNALGHVEEGSLPGGDRTWQVKGIPFQFPARTSAADHVDIGQSLFRYRLGEGYRDAAPTTTWPETGQLDPARIRVRVPNRAYQRLWLIAGSDGEPNSTPVVTARFFKPGKGWALDAAATVPEFNARSRPKGAQKLKVKMLDGAAGSLWLLPIELDAAALASDFREEPVLNLELTKEVQDFRAFPDPMFYDRHPAGLPSAVRLYALTLEAAPVSMVSSGNRTTKVYPWPEQPVWVVNLKNSGAEARAVQVSLEVRSPGGRKEKVEWAITMPSFEGRRLEHKPELREYGLHWVRASLWYEGGAQAREGTFLTVPPDTRVTDERTSRWGLWEWNGGHGTNADADENLHLMRAVGCRIGGHVPHEKRKRWGIAPTAALAPMLYGGLPEWARKDPYDPAEYEKFSEEFGQSVAKMLEKDPDLQYVSVFAEHAISLAVTHGNPPESFGLPWHTYADAEKASIRAHFISAKAAFEGTRKHAPKVKFLFGHCGPLFSLPFMRDGYPKELFDGYGVDSPQFERMPERPPRAVEPNHMYFLKQEMKRLGYEKKELVHVESYYPSSHPLALGHRGSADSMVRTAVLSLAQGTSRFLACWTTYDCEGYWGSQHYGCIGLIGRRPEYNPKPAAAAFATMTQVLDTATYDGYLPTGSRSAYCVRFKDSGDRWVYALWTVRGTRPVTLRAAAKAALTRVDENGNAMPLAVSEGRTNVPLGQTPVWVLARGGPIEAAEAGTPVYTESPGPHVRTLEDFESADWSYSPECYPRYALNEWDVVRTPGPMKAERVGSAERRSRVWRVALTEAPEGKPFVSWYGVFSPPRPIPIPGRPKALGIFARGISGWGRIVYEIADAKGEVFQSIGTKDEWNCDDVHSWSYLNFDGWRYLEFPLPGNAPGDDYREKDSVWWNHSEEGIVDLPLSLNKVIIEMQTHQIYVDELLPVQDRTIEMDDLLAVYESPEMMTERPVEVQRAAAGTLRPKATGSGLPNPILGLEEKGVGEPTEILRLYPPEHQHDGTRVHVAFRPVEGAKEYQVWVSAYPDGRGAIVQVKGQQTEPLVSGLKASFPLYFVVTYTDAEGKQSKPSRSVRTLLKDEFPMQ